MLNLLPIGEFSIAKYTKHGIWVEAAGTKIFIHFSKTFTDPRTWSEEQSEPGIMSGYPLLSQKTIADSERKEAAPSIGTALVAVKVDEERIGKHETRRFGETRTGKRGY